MLLKFVLVLVLYTGQVTTVEFTSSEACHGALDTASEVRAIEGADGTMIPLKAALCVPVNAVIRS